MTVATKPISARLASLFNLRWMLGRYGNDPCDEWAIDDLLGLPDGLTYQDGQVQFQCRVCEKWTEWPADVEDFDPDAYQNVCGGSPRCCP